MCQEECRGVVSLHDQQGESLPLFGGCRNPRSCVSCHETPGTLCGSATSSGLLLNSWQESTSNLQEKEAPCSRQASLPRC